MAQPNTNQALLHQPLQANNPATAHTHTSIPPAGEQAKDAGGMCIMGVKSEWTTWEPVATVLPQLIDAGAVAELTEAEYWASIPPVTDLP